MPTSKETLETLRAQYAQEQQKQRELAVLVLQYKPNNTKNTIDPEEIFDRREIDRLNRDLIRMQRANQNMEQYVEYLKNIDKPHVPDVEPPPNPHIPDLNEHGLPWNPKPKVDQPPTP